MTNSHTGDEELKISEMKLTNQQTKFHFNCTNFFTASHMQVKHNYRYLLCSGYNIRTTYMVLKLGKKLSTHSHTYIHISISVTHILYSFAQYTKNC